MEFLKPEELASECKVPLKTVYGWNHRGVGPKVTRVGKHVRYARRDVDEWLAARRDGATKTPQ